MNTSSRQAHSADCRAFTMVEVAVVIMTVVVLFAVVLPGLAKPRRRPHPIRCENNLRNVDLALTIFATDNQGLYPWQLSVTNGGTKELPNDLASLATHFRTLSNELSTPKLLICPQDQRRQWATNFATLTSNNLSYFLGLDATEEVPQSILSGDRNLTLNGVELRPGPVTLKPGGTNGFSANLHQNPGQQNSGHLLFGDGSIQHFTSPPVHSAFQDALNASPNQSLRLLIP